MSVPSTTILPAVGSWSRFTQRRRVDLPEPDRPITTKISPSATSMLALFTPTTWPVRSRIARFEQPALSNSSASPPGSAPKIFVTLASSTLANLPSRSQAWCEALASAGHARWNLLRRS